MSDWFECKGCRASGECPHGHPVTCLKSYGMPVESIMELLEVDQSRIQPVSPNMTTPSDVFDDMMTRLVGREV